MKGRLDDELGHAARTCTGTAGERAALDINITAPFLRAREAVRLMKAQEPRVASIIHPGAAPSSFTMRRGRTQASPGEGPNDYVMAAEDVAKVAVLMAALPGEVNLYEATILPDHMRSFIGRGVADAAQRRPDRVARGAIRSAARVLEAGQELTEVLGWRVRRRAGSWAGWRGRRRRADVESAAAVSFRGQPPELLCRDHPFHSIHYRERSAASQA